MTKQTSTKAKIIRLGLGYGFLLFGFVGGFIPVLQGWVFIALGLIFPFLNYMGYEKGSTDPEALFYLLAAFTLLPAALKLLTALLLIFSPLEKRISNLP